MDYKLLLLEATKASENTYSPYSHFPVGAALITKQNKIYKGCNVENASFGLTNCAERTCMFTAYADGVKKEDIEAIAIYTPQDHAVFPCGACRQVMVELLLPECKVIIGYKDNEDIVISNVGELMPFSFTSEELKND